MGDTPKSEPESATTIQQGRIGDRDPEPSNVRATSLDEVSVVLSDDAATSLPPLGASEIAEAPVSVRPFREADGLQDRGEIARGGMGAIHCVVDRRLLRQIALKMLPMDTDPGSEPSLRFIEEAQITGQLDHPNIVPVHALGVSGNGSLYFTMKLVRGKTLSDVLHDCGDKRLEADNLERLIQILFKVCDAISFAHNRGVVHRDLKPSNIMIGNYGQVYVMDWGLALLRNGPRLVSDEGKVIGTPGYMAPEQAWGKDSVDERSDIYGIGGLIYRVLTGKRPHHSQDHLSALKRTRYGAVDPPQDLCADMLLPPELCRIAMRALEEEPDQRYQTVSELRHDLESFRRGGGWLATRDYKDGAVIIEEGADADEAYIIVSGTCEAFKDVEGERVSLRRMGEGEVFGETAILTGKPRTASVVAVGDVTVKVVTDKSLERELARNSFTDTFVRALAERFRELDAKLT